MFPFRCSLVRFSPASSAGLLVARRRRRRMRTGGAAARVSRSSSTGRWPIDQPRSRLSLRRGRGSARRFRSGRSPRSSGCSSSIPNLPRIKLELGVLYFRLGSFVEARRYFNEAVAGSDVPDEVRTRVARLSLRDRPLSSRIASPVSSSAASSIRPTPMRAGLGPRARARARCDIVRPIRQEGGPERLRQRQSPLQLRSWHAAPRHARGRGTFFQSKYFRVHRLDLASPRSPWARASGSEARSRKA